MSKRLDDLSRNLASGMSRRQALQIFAAGLLATAFGRSTLSVQAAGQGQAIADFCKTICTPFFPGNGNRGLFGNYVNYSNGDGTLYGECMSSCHACDGSVQNPCGSGICVQVELTPGEPVPYCLSS